jgi:hypothetical protein
VSAHLYSENLEAVPQGIERSGLETHNSPPFCIEVKNDGAIPLLLHTSSWLGAKVIKAKDKFT